MELLKFLLAASIALLAGPVHAQYYPSNGQSGTFSGPVKALGTLDVYGATTLHGPASAQSFSATDSSATTLDVSGAALLPGGYVRPLGNMILISSGPLYAGYNEISLSSSTYYVLEVDGNALSNYAPPALALSEGSGESIEYFQRAETLSVARSSGVVSAADLTQAAHLGEPSYISAHYSFWKGGGILDKFTFAGVALSSANTVGLERDATWGDFVSTGDIELNAASGLGLWYRLWGSALYEVGGASGGGSSLVYQATVSVNGSMIGDGSAGSPLGVDPSSVPVFDAAGGLAVGGTDLVTDPVNHRVGIGTSSPATTLDVNGSAQFGSGAAKSTFTATGDLALYGSLTVGQGASLAYLTSGININSQDLNNAVGTYHTPAFAGTTNSGGAAGLYFTQEGHLDANGELQTRQDAILVDQDLFAVRVTTDPLSDDATNTVLVAAVGQSSGVYVNGPAYFGSAPTKSTFTATGYWAPVAHTGAELQALAAGAPRLVVVDSDDDDLYISTGTGAAGQWRNERTGLGP